MSVLQKFAWFNLAVIALTLTTLLSLIPFLGRGALGSFGFLGLMGFGPLFFWHKRGQVVTDERDRLIQARSWIIAYAIFWVIFVLVAAVLSAMFYAPDGAVPVWIIQFSVFCGLMIVYTLASIAILVQYRMGSQHGE